MLPQTTPPPAPQEQTTCQPFSGRRKCSRVFRDRSDEFALPGNACHAPRARAHTLSLLWCRVLFATFPSTTRNFRMRAAAPSLRVLALLLSAALGSGSGLPTATPALRHPCTGLFLPFSGCNVRATVTIPDGSSASSVLAAGDGVTACAFVRVGAGVASSAVLTLSSATSGFQGSLVLQPSPGDR